MALMSLDKSALALAYFIAACLVITGVIELVAAIQLKRAIAGEWSMIYCAALTILLSILLFMVPGAGTQGLVCVIGLFAIVLGILLIMVAPAYAAYNLRSRRPYRCTGISSKRSPD
jgi:uncharacterized membrane protein HdeD (DUF308 family)